MSTDGDTPTESHLLPAPFRLFCQDRRPSIIAVRARPGPDRFALATAVLRTMSSPGVVVATAEAAGAYRQFFGAPHSTRIPWTVLEGGNSDGGIRAVARALHRARELVADADREGALSALWLPSHILEAFGLLPVDGAGVVLIDSWDGLLSEYLADGAGNVEAWPTTAELEQILFRTLRRHAQALVVVIVDASSRSRLAGLADAVVEVVSRGQYGTLSGSVLITRKDRGTPERTSHRFMLDGGRLRWQADG